MPADLADDLAVPDRGARLSTAVVTAIPSPRLLTVNMDGASVTCPRLLGYTAPKVGDVALVASTLDGRVYALGALATGTAPTPPAPPPPPPGGGTATFPALAAGSYRGGVWRTDRTDVIQGDWQAAYGLNQGAWFYGGSPAATLAGATMMAAAVYVDRRPGGWNRGQTLTAYLHAAATRPSTPPARLATFNIGSVPVGEARWLPIPIGWAQQIAAGTARGVGIYSGTADPYIVLASLSQNGATGALRIGWKRPP